MCAKLKPQIRGEICDSVIQSAVADRLTGITGCEYQNLTEHSQPYEIRLCVIIGAKPLESQARLTRRLGGRPSEPRPNSELNQRVVSP